MTVVARGGATAQLTLDFEPGLLERYPSAMDRLRAAVYASRLPLKTIAADMDTSASTLSRKLAEDQDDPRRFSLRDLERYIDATGDTTVIEYLALKYLQSEDIRRQQALSQATRLLAELAPLVEAMKGAKP